MIRLWAFRIVSRPTFYRPGARETDYQELAFSRSRDALDFAFDLYEMPGVTSVHVSDLSGREDDFVLRERSAA